MLCNVQFIHAARDFSDVDLMISLRIMNVDFFVKGAGVRFENSTE